MADATDAPDSTTTNIFELAAESELRFEIPPECSTATITLTRGSVEMFGIELALNRAYPLRPLTNAAAFTWHGATVSLTAPAAAMAYIAPETPMPAYLNAHAALQSRREIARASGQAGPRAVVVGPRDSGKTTLVNVLAAYGVKANGGATIVDLDPSGSGAVPVVPEALGVSVVTHLDVEEGGAVHDRVASVMLGHRSPRDNLPVSRLAFATVGGMLERLLAQPGTPRHVGCVVDTCGDVEGKDGPECVAAAASAVRADVVLVLGAERLFASVQKVLAGTGTEAVLLPKSGGVVSRDAATRALLQARMIKGYFYGVDGNLSPFTTVVNLSEVTILKVGGAATVVPDSVLPAGAVSTLDPLKPTVVRPSRELLHAVLAVSQAGEEGDVLKRPVFGYVHVVKIDVDGGVATVLAPNPGRIPSRLLLAGSTKWIE